MARKYAKGEARRKRGRPSTFTWKTANGILKMRAQGVPMKYAAMAHGITAETWANWKVDHPDLVQKDDVAVGKFVAACVTNVHKQGKKFWAADMTLLERVAADEFAKPEAKLQLQMLQVNGDAQKVALNAAWTQQPVALPGQQFDDIELETTWEEQHVVPNLPAPSSSADSQKVEAAGVPGTGAAQAIEVEAEVVDMSGNPKLRLPDNQLTQIEKLQRYGSGNQFEPGSRLTAAKPTPLSAPGFNANGERPMIDWRD